MRKKINMALMYIIYIIAGTTLGMVAGSNGLFGIVWALLFFYLCLIINIIIHEGGHLIFGLLTGYKFQSFRVFNIMLCKQNGKYSLKKHSLAGTGGQCILTPPEWHDGMPYVLYNLGGPLLNIIVALITLIIYYYTRSTFYMVNTITGLALGLTNGIPMELDPVNNDGYNAISLGKNKEALYSLYLQLYTNAKIAEGGNLEDLPESLFRLPDESEMNNSMVATEAVLYCNYLMSVNRFEEARDIIHKLTCQKNAIVQIHRNLLICDEIFCKIYLQDDLSTITPLYDSLKKFMKSMKKHPAILRTQYIYAIASGNQDADKYKEQFNQIKASYPYASEIKSEEALMNAIEKEYQ